MKVYLDFQIWDYIHKNQNVREYFTTKDDWYYFISVAHQEEIHKAKKGEKGDKVGLTSELEKTMISMSEPGVIKPTKNGVAYVPHGYNESMQNIIKYDSLDTVKQRSIIRKGMDKEAYDPKNLFSGMDNSKERYKSVWETERVKKELDLLSQNTRRLQIEFSYNENSLKKYLVETYGETQGELLLHQLIESSKTDIKPAIYREIRENYHNLEYVMEQLFFILTKCGFKRDGSDKHANSGSYDIQHSICATMCDIFITNDIGFAEKYKAIAYYLAIPIKIITWDELKKEI